MASAQQDALPDPNVLGWLSSCSRPEHYHRVRLIVEAARITRLIQRLNNYRLASPEARAKYVLERNGLSPLRILVGKLSEIEFDGYLLVYSYQHEDATSPIQLTAGDVLTLLIDRKDLEQFNQGDVTKQEVFRRSKIFVDNERVELSFWHLSTLSDGYGFLSRE